MSKDLLSSLVALIQHKRKLDDEIIEFIDNMFSGNSQKVLDVISKGVVKYIHQPSNRITWIARGNKCDHLVYPQLYCSCQDFYKNVVIKRNRNYCKHVLAQSICEITGKFETKKRKDEDFMDLINETDLNF